MTGVQTCALPIFRLTPEAAVAGFTRHAAQALGLADRGQLRAGLRADLAWFGVDHPRELACVFGQRPDCRTWVAALEQS